MITHPRIALSRDRHNTTECDRCILNLMRPCLRQEGENSQVQQIITQFNQISDYMAVIILTIDGQVQFMTQRAEALLSTYSLPSAPGSLPDTLLHWFKYQISLLTQNDNVPYACRPLYTEQAGQQFIIRIIPDPIRAQYLLLLEEQQPQTLSIAALELIGLTEREAEVLFWVAKDKSNAGIARVLGCCEGTVRKHLEHLYAKLGVQTRTGAVMVALERLGLLNSEFVAIST